ncbi:MAG: CinA family protein [Candidatus Thermoplasmatota archaeon]|nr:CinA family protein [Candidatus Thermoplasmatota archaeon]MBU4070702.1 CinA family protein [Candidatus Thermoplasmatota archaeon]MBU4144101.1 CinA family protein [Candidatus Thermoplasmatota archaeon]MBU4591832.1 CinA family protein [Candidatus Thermoplasmatota archaeon]
MNSAERLGTLLSSKCWTVAVAESCTGGLLASTITDVPGSSLYFLGGIIAYSNSTKTEILGVPTETMVKNGSVSDRTTVAMAIGAMNNFGCDFSIAISGIAGPSGGSEAKPIGTVFIAVATEDGEQVKTFTFKGTRQEIKARSVEAALGMACEALVS